MQMETNILYTTSYPTYGGKGDFDPSSNLMLWRSSLYFGIVLAIDKMNGFTVF